MTSSRYAIVRTIGSGGMAEVMEAVLEGDSGFRRRVAVKRLLQAHSKDASFVRMFLDEARIASQLHHAGIVGILDYGVVDDIPFQILEYIDGETARDLAKRNSMPLEVALYIATEVARALHYAHTSDAAVVHRDVKPSNILVSRTGDVKLADFGIAFAAERLERTTTGVSKGTPGFMAPEQLVGGRVDARADVFSLGCTLHALAFGETPLGRTNNFERLLHQEALTVDPSAPADVAAILSKAIAISPSARYASAGAMAEDLGAALATRLRTDPKGALLTWLASLAPKPSPVAALDALLMPEALLEKNGEEWRMQTTRREPHVPSPAEPSVRPRSVRQRVMAAVAAAVVGAGLVAGGSRLRASKRAPSRSTVASAAELVPLVETGSVEPLAVGLPTNAPSTPHSVAAQPHHTAAPAVVTAPADDVRGTLAIRGGAYRGASVSIDGRMTPYGAPHYFDLPVGRHKVELRVDGGVAASSAVDIRPDHTPTAPLYWP